MLCDYFGVGDMPHFWVQDCNLLDILRDDDTDDYFESLLRATETLNTYPHQRNLSLGRTITHFALPGDDAWDYDDSSSSSSEYESICYRNDNKYWSQKQYHVQYKCVQNYEVAGYRSENQYSITNHFLGQYQYPNGCQYNSNNNTYKCHIWK